MLWHILYGLSGVLLLLFWDSRNAVWGGATLGFLIGLGIAFFAEGFDWWTVAKSATIAVLIGAATEGLSAIGRRRP